MSVWGDLIDKLEEQGLGGLSITHEDRDRIKARRMERLAARDPEQAITLPDGQRVTRRSTRAYRYAVAVHVPNDELEPAHWEVYRWVTNDRARDQAHDEANTIYFQTAILDVTKED